jgi:glycosyltransferase involved in cell wall biosynthesis
MERGQKRVTPDGLRARHRILMLITGLEVGGAETQVVSLTKALIARNWNVAVVSLLPLASYADVLKQLGISVYTLGMSRGVPDPRAIARLAQIIRQWRPDILHSHMVHANLLARCTRLMVQIPALICTVHNTRETSDRGGSTWWKERLYGMTERLADRTTIICETAWRHYVSARAAHAERLEVIHNGIDCNRFAPNASVRAAARLELGLGDEFVWLAVGRLTCQKDYPNLFRGLASLKERAWTLLIAGQGPLLPELEALVKDLSIAEHVRFLGLREDIPALHQAADAYVLSSAWEGLPLSALEASASGLPCVVTDVGGNAEVVLHEVSGFVVPPGDSAALTVAMRRMMTSTPLEVQGFAEAARKHCVDRFEISSIVDKWEAVYKSLLPSPASSKKILYTITRSLRGGGTNHVKNLLANTPPGCRPILVTGDSGYLTEEAARMNIPSRIIPSMRRAMNPLRDTRALIEIVRLLRSEKPALVHAHTAKAGFLFRLAGAMTGTPVVFTAHMWSFSDGLSRLQRTISLPLERFAARVGGKVIAVSQQNADAALTNAVVKPTNLQVIWNGISDTQFQANPGTHAKMTIVMVSRFQPPKDHRTLLEALAQIHVSIPWEVLLVGDGPTRMEMEKAVDSLGIRASVHFLGERGNIAEVLADCDLFVLSSNWEGLPISILEAMRAGLPVIATNVGGCGEGVTDGLTGYLTTRGDAAELANRIETLLLSPTLLQKMGEAGRARFQSDFRIESMIQKTWSVYESEAPALGFISSLHHLQTSVLDELGSRSLTEANPQPRVAGCPVL